MRTTGEPGVLVTALPVEAAAVRAGRPGLPVVRGGMRARAPRAVRSALRDRPDAAVVVTGVAGAVTEAARPGDLVVADRVRRAPGAADGTDLLLPHAGRLAAALRAAGATVHVGTVAELDRPLWRTGVAGLPPDVLAVDLESARLLALAGPGHRAVVRAVVDTPDRPLLGLRTVGGGVAALAALRRVGPAARAWAAGFTGTGPSPTTAPAPSRQGSGAPVQDSTSKEVRHP